jgi:hypothetical protein
MVPPSSQQSKGVEVSEGLGEGITMSVLFVGVEVGTGEFVRVGEAVTMAGGGEGVNVEVLGRLAGSEVSVNPLVEVIPASPGVSFEVPGWQAPTTRDISKVKHKIHAGFNRSPVISWRGLPEDRLSVYQKVSVIVQQGNL